MIDENKLIEDIKSDDFIKKVIQSNESLNDILINLIEKQQKFENTVNFNYFNLFSDNTLKSMKKDELIEYIHDIYHNWKACDYFYNNAVSENYRLSNQLDDIVRNSGGTR